MHNNSDKIKTISDFCKNYERIFIYGAGVFGKDYLKLLQTLGIKVDGFITTDEQLQIYCGLRVFSLDEIKHHISERDGIIPAFKGSEVEQIEELFLCGRQKPAILDFAHRDMRVLLNDLSCVVLSKFKDAKPLKSMQEWKNLLIVRIDALGDLVCTTACLNTIHDNAPNAKITMIVRSDNIGVLKNSPCVNRLVPYTPLDYETSLYDYETDRKMKEFVLQELGDEIFDVVFLPRAILSGRNFMEELFIAFYVNTRCRVGHIIAEEPSRSRNVYTYMKNKFSVLSYQTTPLHETDFQLDMLKACGCEMHHTQNMLYVTEEEKSQAYEELMRNGIKVQDILIAVGIVGSFPRRNWRTDRYNCLIERFYAVYGSRIKWILFGGPDAVKDASRIDKGRGTVIDMTGKLLIDRTIACMSCCDMYLGSNTGLLHVAAALGKATFTLYSVFQGISAWDGNGPVRYGAKGANIHIDFLPAGGLDDCKTYCSKNYSHCINQITPAQVQKEMEQYIRNLLPRGAQAK